ncbi:hypothetical protein BGM09_08055 [Streptomyces sp. CBMA29]|nr:hypothetical protein [Streptomyces sp. CBMA29]
MKAISTGVSDLQRIVASYATVGVNHKNSVLLLPETLLATPAAKDETNEIIEHADSRRGQVREVVVEQAHHPVAVFCRVRLALSWRKDVMVSIPI